MAMCTALDSNYSHTRLTDASMRNQIPILRWPPTDIVHVSTSSPLVSKRMSRWIELINWWAIQRVRACLWIWFEISNRLVRNNCFPVAERWAVIPAAPFPIASSHCVASHSLCAVCGCGFERVAQWSQTGRLNECEASLTFSRCDAVERMMHNHSEYSSDIRLSFNANWLVDCLAKVEIQISLRTEIVANLQCSSKRHRFCLNSVARHRIENGNGRALFDIRRLSPRMQIAKWCCLRAPPKWISQQLISGRPSFGW